MPNNVILASRSAARVKMLRSIGLSFKAMPADIDEENAAAKIKNSRKIAPQLAKLKAIAVSQRNPGALVIGADQVLLHAGKPMTKAKDKKDAVKKLKSLRGKKHVLISSVAVAKNGKILWTHTDETEMTTRKFSDKTLKAYVKKAGPALTRSVGAMELEAHGAWLMEKAEGDFFTILGLPLLPLLGYLAEEHGFTP